MKKINFLFVLMFTLLFIKASANNKYKIDEALLEKQFNAAENINEKIKQAFFDATKLTVDTDYVKPTTGMNKQSKAAIAGSAALALTYCGAVGGFVILIPFVLCVATFIPVHRFILGTGNGGAKVFFAYFCTGSGCSVGLLADVIFLWIDKDGTKYENCNKVLMWNE